MTELCEMTTFVQGCFTCKVWAEFPSTQGRGVQGSWVPPARGDLMLPYVRSPLATDGARGISQEIHPSAPRNFRGKEKFLSGKKTLLKKA